MRTIAIYVSSDGRWSLHPEPESEIVQAELADGYVAAQGPTGSARILSQLPNELGMTIEQAIARGILTPLRDGASEFERVTLVSMKSFPPSK
jgi:hypothetical protein